MSNQEEPDAVPELDNRLHLLLVEDNNDDVQIFVDLISDHISTPVDLSLASTLAEAVDELKSGRVDVILLDLSLPDSDGEETIEQVQKAAPGAPIVVLTGHDDEEEAVSAVSQGVQDFLVKGKVDGSLLMRSIRYAIERNQLLRRLREANERVEALAGMLPVCTSCKKVKHEDGTWHDMEKYIREYTQAKVHQTLCPGCGRRFR